MIYAKNSDGKTIASGHIHTDLSMGTHGAVPLDAVIADIDSVQADGDELERCISMTGKNPGCPVAHFFGDDARFIVANW